MWWYSAAYGSVQYERRHQHFHHFLKQTAKSLIRHCRYRYAGCSQSAMVFYYKTGVLKLIYQWHVLKSSNTYQTKHSITSYRYKPNGMFSVMTQNILCICTVRCCLLYRQPRTQSYNQHSDSSDKITVYLWEKNNCNSKFFPFTPSECHWVQSKEEELSVQVYPFGGINHSLIELFVFGI